jgi:prepilin-type processing-associated H-X9-DG protein
MNPQRDKSLLCPVTRDTMETSKSIAGQVMLSFRLWTIFYVFALIAAAMATFGIGGIIAGLFVLGFWTLVVQSPNPIRMLASLIVALCALILVAALLLPAVSFALEAARRSQCTGQLKQLTLAILNYHTANGALPSASIADANGTPLLSWRVSILPHFERQAIYNRIDMSKAWDDSSNRQVLSTTLSFLQCPSERSPAPVTNYFAIVGPRTAWHESRGRNISEFRDGAKNTILLIEAHHRGVNWAKPRDLTIDEAVDLLSQPFASHDGHEVSNGFFYKPSVGRNVAFADGSVAFMIAPLHRKLAEALLTVDGREQIDSSEFDRATEPHLDYAKCYGFGMFVALSLLPIFWVRWNTTKAISAAVETSDV